MGLVSQVSPVQTALRNFTGDEGRSSEGLIVRFAVVRLPSNTLREGGHPGTAAQCQ
jgi:hypothetical protein